MALGGASVTGLCCIVTGWSQGALRNRERDRARQPFALVHVDALPAIGKADGIDATRLYQNEKQLVPTQ
jgi:hypothetical protein